MKRVLLLMFFLMNLVSADAAFYSPQALWLSSDFIAWKLPQEIQSKVESVWLFASEDASLVVSDGYITGGDSYKLEVLGSLNSSYSVYQKAPWLKGALLLDARFLKNIESMIQNQLVLELRDKNNKPLRSSGLKLWSLLDEIMSTDADLGVNFIRRNKTCVPVFRLWSPVASSVKLSLYRDSKDTSPLMVTEMVKTDRGVWELFGLPDWERLYYRYRVTVYSPSEGKMIESEVTDPYSVSLSMNSQYSQVIDLRDSSLMPKGWKELRPPMVKYPEQSTIYELHVRDFSFSDNSIPEKNRGKFSAFDFRLSRGMRHLAKLARAGMNYIHLLPVFDIASVNEDESQQKMPHIPEDAGVASTLPQAEIGRIRAEDAFNWGYDPYHYMVPEGSYSLNPDGSYRILEFRKMIRALSGLGLGVVMDVVFNHTHSSGNTEHSVLDKIVPGYYYRSDAEGNVQQSSCCPDTASERKMMEKLMVDSLVLWAKYYKVAGFRFDLMGHHTVANLRAIRQNLDSLTEKNSGIDGKSIILYGEGWKFGSLNDRFPDEACHQQNMAGTGVGTFNDRLRDSARGGNYDHGTKSDQGFINGLYVDPNNALENVDTPKDKEEQRALLLNYTDNVRLGMAGNLADYWMVSSTGAMIRGSQLLYRGSPGAGYADDPQETVNYVSAHDNYSLWDQIAAKAPFHTKGRKPQETATARERAKMQVLGLGIVAFSQGMSFFHAGSELLRSKSGDGDSYDSGDWFNRLDFSYNDNNWGVGLPPAWKNKHDWEFWRRRLDEPALTPTKEDIRFTLDRFLELLKIRASSPLFHLKDAASIQSRVRFLNGSRGKAQVPGLIVMQIRDFSDKNLDPKWDRIIVVINSAPDAVLFQDRELQGADLNLHPDLMNYDELVSGFSFDKMAGRISVPGRGVAVLTE
jgi:pullulanase-type alpha-1,6-glucosidase